MSRDIEKDVLSACMLNSDNLMCAVEAGVTGKWFASRGGIFDALVAIDAEWGERNHLNILSPIFDKFEAAIDVCQDTPQWAFNLNDVEGAIDVLKGAYAKRKILNTLSTAQSRLAKGDDPFDVAMSLSSVSEDVDQVGTNGGERTTSQLIDDALEIDRKVASGEQLGLPLPWIDFHRRTFGIPSKALTPLGGRDGKGKSRLMTFLAEYWVRMGIPILYFPFEDSAERFISNVGATNGKYDMFTARRNHVPSDFIPNHENVMERLKGFPLYVEDMPDTAEGICGTIARYKRKYGIKGVVIDGLKDVIPTIGENQTSKEGHINSMLVRACKKHDVAGISVSHLTDLDDDQWISKRNIRGSKNQTQSARMVLMYQDAGIPSEIKSKYDFIEDCIVLDCQKSSYGNRAMVVLRPEFERGRFVEVKPRELGR